MFDLLIQVKTIMTYSSAWSLVIAIVIVMAKSISTWVLLPIVSQRSSPFIAWCQYKDRTPLPPPQSPPLMPSLLEVVVVSVILLLCHVSPEERYPFQPQIVDMKSNNPVPVQVVSSGHEFPDRWDHPGHGQDLISTLGWRRHFPRSRTKFFAWRIIWTTSLRITTKTTSVWSIRNGRSTDLPPPTRSQQTLTPNQKESPQPQSRMIVLISKLMLLIKIYPMIKWMKISLNMLRTALLVIIFTLTMRSWQNCRKL